MGTLMISTCHFFFFEKNGTPWPPNRRGKRWEFTRLFRILGHVEVNGL